LFVPAQRGTEQSRTGWVVVWHGRRFEKKKQEKVRGKKAKIEKRFHVTAGCAGWSWGPIQPLIRSSPPLSSRVEVKNIMSLRSRFIVWHNA